MELKYSLNDRPKLSHMLLYGIQWLLISIPVVLTSTFIAPEGETIAYTQKLFGLMGAVMVVQALFGHRLPLVAGPATALMMGILSATAQGCSQSAIYTALMIGGIFIALVAISGVMSRNKIPFFGKSGMSRTRDLKSISSSLRSFKKITKYYTISGAGFQHPTAEVPPFPGARLRRNRTVRSRFRDRRNDRTSSSTASPGTVRRST